MIHVVALIYAGKDGLKGLRRYESRVILILEGHGGRLLSAFKPRGHEKSECPDEIHLLEFPSEEALTSYRADPRIKVLSEVRNSAVSRTTVYVSEEIIRYE